MTVTIPHSRKVFPTTSKKTHANKQQFRLVEAEDKALNTVLAAKTVETHLKKGEIVVFVGAEKPKQLSRMLKIMGIDVETAIKTGKLFIFSSQPALSGRLYLSASYQPLFAELVAFVNVPIDCIVIMGIERLFNLTSQYHAYASISQFMQAADELSCQVFAQYIAKQTLAHRYLATACDSLVVHYLMIQRKKQHNGYRLLAKNKPNQQSVIE